jgi:hypothetical protein
MRTLSISIAAVAVLSLSSVFTAAQAATRTGVTSTPPRLSTTDATHLYLAAKTKKTKKHGAKSHGFCPPGQAKKPGRGSAFRC